MKYYLIAGEASGDLHASHLMRSLRQHDKEAEFRFFGGDNMAAVGGTMVKHYRELAYMGFIPVLLHLPAILRNMKRCKEDIRQWQPDAVILIDYPGFNLKIAKYVHRLKFKVYYYISPKIWAWKEYRIKNIKRDVDELFSILPFEVDFYEKKHHYPIHYVGNPTKNEVDEYWEELHEVMGLYDDGEQGMFFRSIHRPIVALLAGSRRQEIKDNLPAMLQVARQFPDYQFVVAGAPGIDEAYYAPFLKGTDVRLACNSTFRLLYESRAALVTSGTATLEAACFNVPQVVCYKTPLPHIIGWLRRRILKVKYISLVNLIADREVVPELVADTFSVANIKRELGKLLAPPPEGMEGQGKSAAQAMTTAYANEVRRRLGSGNAADGAASMMVQLLKKQRV